MLRQTKTANRNKLASLDFTIYTEANAMKQAVELSPEDATKIGEDICKLMWFKG